MKTTQVFKPDLKTWVVSCYNKSPSTSLGTPDGGPFIADFVLQWCKLIANLSEFWSPWVAACFAQLVIQPWSGITEWLSPFKWFNSLLLWINPCGKTLYLTLANYLGTQQPQCSSQPHPGLRPLFHLVKGTSRISLTPKIHSPWIIWQRFWFERPWLPY